MKHFLHKIVILPRQTGIMLVKVYQYCISPLYASSCRFQPTCSEYARQALAERGLIRGAILILWRLARCHPLCKGGWDPVPPANTGKSSAQRIDTVWKATDI